MGDWYQRPDGTWAYDRNAPSPDPTITGMLPVIEAAQQLPVVEPEVGEQEDLSHLDEQAGPLVNTEKVGPLDTVLVQPPQDPDWTPEVAL